MLKNAKKNGFSPLDASLCEQISSASKSVVFITFSRCTLILCLISFFTINVMTKMWSFWWRNLWSLLLPKICDMRWWAVFDHGEKNWKSNFVLDPILRFGQKSETVLSHFELWKKVEVLNPQLKSWILSTYIATTIFRFRSFWWREKRWWPMALPSQSIGRRKCHLFDEEICGPFVTKKSDMRWWVAFDFDQVNWKNNFALYLILSFRQKFGLFLKQSELSKKDWKF